MLSTRCCKLLAYKLLSVIQFHLSTWFNLEMSDWRCRIMIIMIPFQLSVCITEELFAKYLYCYPDTGNQITFRLSQKMYCEWYLDWDMHAFIWICWQCSGLAIYFPAFKFWSIICLFLFISPVDLVFILFGRINGLFCSLLNYLHLQH